MSYTLTLKTEVRTDEKGTTVVDFTVTAPEGDVSPAVFAIEVLPRSADPEAPVYRFSHVCHPSELTEFPEGEPMDNCYFRVSEIDMIFDTETIARRVIEHVRSDIAHLCAELRQLDEALPETTTESF